MSWLHSARTRLALLFDRRGAESRMDKEIRFHIDMETERLVRYSGLDPQEARRQALVAFGGVEKHKEDLRDGRGRAWLSGMSLDLKLGIRMMAKYPGLTLVGVLGMSVAVAIIAVAFGIIYTVIDPSLPLPEGDRVIAVNNFDPRTGDDARGTHLHDLATWREELTAIDLLGAYRTIDRNLITPRGRPEPVRLAEMSATGFQIARVTPLMGRYFNADDERIGAPPVVVIGHSVWQNRFAGEPGIVGRTLQLGATAHTIIGVMPAGFAFPVNNRIWAPLRLNTADHPRGKAPPLDVFGRLATGATIDDVRTQLVTIGQRLATAYPETHSDLRPRVLPYPHIFLDSPQLLWVFHLVQVLVSMLLVVIGTNVAVLVYARTATRMGEIAVRSALGASRRRIVSQLFAEALVLSVAAAVIGLAGAHIALREIQEYVARFGGEQLPFWMDFAGFSVGQVLYVAVLAVLGAAIVGVVPALKATRRDVQANLQHLGAGGSGMRLGKTWTFLIVTQVAVAVACLPIALNAFGKWVLGGAPEPGFATREILVATLQLDQEGAARDDPRADEREFAARFADLQAELVRRLEAEPRVSQVVLTSVSPGSEPSLRMEAQRTSALIAGDTTAGSGGTGHAVGIARVEPHFFGALDIPLLAGRGFETADVSPAAAGVIVNQSFVQQILGSGEVLGRRVRRVATDGKGRPENASAEPWYEIIGVVPDFPELQNPKILEPKLYQPLGKPVTELQPGRQRSVEGRLQRELPGQPALVGEEVRPSTLAIRVRGMEPAAFADRLRELTVAVDPMLRFQDMNPLDARLNEDQAINRGISIAMALLTFSVMLLSSAGIYALMSFTITRRRREIGIRSALGAGARSVLWSVLSRAMGQIALGILIGIALTGGLDRLTGGEMLDGRSALLLPGVALLMGTIGILSAVGPARQALRIQPTEALRSEG